MPSQMSSIHFRALVVGVASAAALGFAGCGGSDSSSSTSTSTTAATGPTGAEGSSSASEADFAQAIHDNLTQEQGLTDAQADCVLTALGNDDSLTQEDGQAIIDAAQQGDPNPIPPDIAAKIQADAATCE